MHQEIIYFMVTLMRLLLYCAIFATAGVFVFPGYFLLVVWQMSHLATVCETVMKCNGLDDRLNILFSFLFQVAE